MPQRLFEILSVKSRLWAILRWVLSSREVRSEKNTLIGARQRPISRLGPRHQRVKTRRTLVDSGV
jgi:hypothetical protein